MTPHGAVLLFRFGRVGICLPQEMRVNTAQDAAQATAAASPTEATAGGTEGDGELQPATATANEVPPCAHTLQL